MLFRLIWMGCRFFPRQARDKAHPNEVVHSEEADEEDDKASQQQNQPAPNTPGCCIACRMQSHQGD